MPSLLLGDLGASPLLGGFTSGSGSGSVGTDTGEGGGEAQDIDTQGTTGILDIFSIPATATFNQGFSGAPLQVFAFTLPANTVFTSVALLRSANYTGYYTNAYQANSLYPALSFSGTALAYLSLASGTPDTGAKAIAFSAGALSGTGGSFVNDQGQILLSDASTLAYLNAHAGQTIYVSYQPQMQLGVGSVENLTALDLQVGVTSLVVTPAPTGYTFGCFASVSDSNGYSIITVTLKDLGGNSIAAPAGGQVFMLGATGGTLIPTLLYIAQGASVGQALISNTVSGNVTVTITAGAGPCLGQTNCVVTAFLIAPPLALLDGGTPGLCLVKLTRANMRDNIRRKLGITPDIDIYAGAAPGTQPFGEPWPTNAVLNQNIGDALRLMGRECGWHSNTMLSITVPPTLASGPQWLPLQGVGAGPYQNLINRVKHIVFKDSTGTTAYRLQARTFEELDRSRRLYDNSLPVSIPREFFIEGYRLALLPGAQAGGTLQLYADTALIGFCSDTDTLDEVPIDYEPVIETIAVWLTLQMHPENREAGAQLQMLPEQIKMDLQAVRRYLTTLNAAHQYGVVPVSGRRRRLR